MPAYLGNKEVSVGVRVDTDRVVLSQEEYASLPVKDSNTMYMVYDDPTLEEFSEHVDDDSRHISEEKVAEIVSENMLTESDIKAMVGNVPNVKIYSYIGTGKYGSSNPCSLTFDFVPKVAIMLGYKSPYGVITTLSNKDYNVVNVMLYDNLTTSYDSTVRVNGFSATGDGHYGKKSADGKTWYWYNGTSAYYQLNDSGYTFYVLAIG